MENGRGWFAFVACNSTLVHIAQRLLEALNDANNRTVPKRRSGSIFPVRAGRIENGFVPVKSFLNATIRLWLRRNSRCAGFQFR